MSTETLTAETNLHRLSRRRNAAIAQFHRWFQLYERPRTPDLVERQLQLFADRFEIVTAAGQPVTTRDGYRDGITAYNEAERHAHHVDHVEVNEIDAHRLLLAAEVTYQHMDPSSVANCARITYEAQLTGSVDFQPLFTSLVINRVEGLDSVAFTDAFPANRALSFVHRWLSLVEAPELGTYGFGELLGPDQEIDLQLGTTSIGNRHDMADWLRQSSERVATSRHTVENFHVDSAHDGLYVIGMDFGWNGTAVDGAPMAGSMRHAWTLLDTGERYCRLMQAKTTPLVPLARIALPAL